MSRLAGIGVEGMARAPGWEAPPIEPARKRPLVHLAIVAGLFALAAFNGYRWWAPTAEASPVVYEGGSLVAAGDWENALYNPAPGAREGGLTVGRSFANRRGEACRRFAEGAIRGVACQRDGDWRVTELRQD